MVATNDLRGRMAVVTGASSGIGLCFCHTLAERGCGLVMISNQKEQLDQCAAAIASEFGVEAIPLFCDLTCDDAAEKIIGFIDSRGLDLSLIHI